MENNKNITIVVATHKHYPMPKYNIYMPVEVGADLYDRDLGYQKDNEGDNISKLNMKFSELTAIYWAWKNINTKYLGLVHYRRHLSLSKPKNKNIYDRLEIVLNEDEIDNIFTEYDGIVPKKRNYFIESLYSHYKNTLHVETLDVSGEVIRDLYPDYLESFEKLKKTSKGYMFNMAILKKDLFGQYLEWLFDILFELENRIGDKEYSSFHARYPGRVSELLFNVWLDNNPIKLKEVNVLDAEPVNWIKKGTSFLKSKFTNSKYESSF